MDHHQESTVVMLALGNPSEAMALEQHLLNEFPETMEIYRAPTGFDAMSLAMNRPRVVLLDQRLPDVMGLDMIDPIRDQIGAENYLIFIGGSGKGGIRPGMRDEALKRGASAIADRPLDIPALTATIRSLLFPEIPPHPHLHGLELLDLVQMFNQKRCDRTLRIFANDGRVGGIYMKRGEITHIEAGAMQGFAAMLDLMQWTEGRIVVYDALLNPERTNDTPTQHLLLEAARIMDEGPQAAAEAVVPSDRPPTVAERQRHTPTPDPADFGDIEETRKAIDGALDAVFGDFDAEAPKPAERKPEPKAPAQPKPQADASRNDVLSIPALDLDTDFDVN